MRNLLLVFLAVPSLVMAQEDLPNILWFTAEDMSPTLGCYGDDYATTPNIDRLASEGVRYTHAYATSPVCSPARSTLITGIYSTTMGSQRLRSAFPIPKRIKGFPTYLRELGYYTTNNVKTDYNVAMEDHNRLIKQSWDESSPEAHWRGREGDQPFFHIFNDMVSHQSRTMVYPYQQFLDEVQSQLSPEKIHDADNAPVPPYYPDTPLVRRTVARYYDCVSLMDQHVGEMLDQLEEDGVADNTIVFFYSDHGSGLPRHKRVLHETGTRVPLIIRFPEKWKHLAPAAPGETVDRIVSFVDFAPTMLSILGQEIPNYMMGEPFLGEAATEPRTYAFTARDRVDEAFDLARAVRDDRWLYIRNFMPHVAYNQPSAYSDLGEIRDEITALAKAGELTKGPQTAYATERKPIEELYDTTNDPLCLKNLAKEEEHAEVLKRLRNEQKKWSRQTRDKGFLIESEANKLAAEKPLLQLSRDFPLAEVRAAAELSGRGPNRIDDMVANLQSDDPFISYWGGVALHSLGKRAAPAEKALKAALKSDSAPTRIEAAGALAKLDHVGLALKTLKEELASDDLAVALHASRTIELMGPRKAKSAIPAMKVASQRAKDGMAGATNPLDVGETDPYMFLGFSVDAFLAAAGVEPEA